MVEYGLFIPSKWQEIGMHVCLCVNKSVHSISGQSCLLLHLQIALKNPLFKLYSYQMKLFVRLFGCAKKEEKNSNEEKRICSVYTFRVGLLQQKETDVRYIVKW